MSSDNILFLEIPVEAKVGLASRLTQSVERINNSLQIRKYFKLAEVSYGYVAGNINSVNYIDYPYSSVETGKIVDHVNLSTRGVLPESSKLDSSPYKDLDILVSKSFETLDSENHNSGYILHEFAPNSAKHQS